MLNKDAIIEQIALLFASFVWTTVVLSAIAIFWVYQDVNARWTVIANMPPEALAQAAAPSATPTLTPTATATVWAGPGPTVTPTSTKPPTSLPTRVVEAPDILPETLNVNEPTPIPVIVHTEAEADEFGVELAEDPQTAPVSVPPAEAPAATLTPAPTTAPTQVARQSAPPAEVEAEVESEIEDEPIPPTPPSEPVAYGDLVPDRLIIDSVGIDTAVVPVGWQVVEQSGQQYSIWQVADFAAGWHKTSAKLGQVGNTVMAGHHNVKGEVFRDLVNVEVGDTVIAYDGNQKYEYVVELKTIVKEKGESLEVRQRNAQWISPTDDERMTFITCWPYTNNTHRVIVVARPI